MKFKLTKNTKDYCWTTLYQIEATVSFGNVSKWELWGWIEKESNLSQEGNAWVYGNALVSDDARVYDDATVSGNARVYGNAWVSDDAMVCGNATVSGNALVSGKIKLECGWCFARKEKYWNVSEVENEWTILLINNYKPDVEETTEEYTLEEVCKMLWKDIKIKK